MNKRQSKREFSKQSKLLIKLLLSLDLRAFETRLTELVSELQPPTRRWRLLLALVTLLTLTGAVGLLTDETAYDPNESLLLAISLRHPLFTGSLLLLLSLFIPPVAIHRRISAPAIIRGRIQEVIGQFNMSCDDRGRLILMPHPRFLHNAASAFTSAEAREAEEAAAAQAQAQAQVAAAAAIYQHQHQQHQHLLEEQERQRRRREAAVGLARWS